MLAELPLIVGIGGTLRTGSTSERALAATLKLAEENGARTQMLAGPELNLATYQPDASDRSDNARKLVELLRKADGVIISSPCYHGSISGHLKNAIDYIEDMKSDPRPYFESRAVGCIVCADGAQAMGSTLSTLRSIIHALRGWPTPYAAAINSGLRPFGADGTINNPEVAEQLRIVAKQVVDFARQMRCKTDAELSFN